MKSALLVNKIHIKKYCQDKFSKGINNKTFVNWFLVLNAFTRPFNLTVAFVNLVIGSDRMHDVH